jgi:hypothetical protein
MSDTRRQLSCIILDKYEDTKGVIRIRNSTKDRQLNSPRNENLNLLVRIKFFNLFLYSFK